MYLLVTRVRDEAQYLAELLESVASQSVTPNLWVIVDNGSTDESAAIIARACEEQRWIRLIQIEATEAYGLFCHAVPIRAGFEAAVDHAARYGIEYKYLGILDADIVPETIYFEKLIHYLESSPKLGIVGGQLYIVKEGREIPEGSGGAPRGGARLYRRDCFEDIGGSIPKSPGWDSETDVLAELHGWQVSKLSGAKAIHKRSTYTRKGQLRGYWRLGKCYYYDNYHPISALLAGSLFASKPPFYHGIAFLLAYCKSFLQRNEQSPDPVIREYFWRSFDRFKDKIKVHAVSALKRLALISDDESQ